MTTLTMDGYVRLGRDRQKIDDWLDDRGLLSRGVVALEVNDGATRALCEVRDADGALVTDDGHIRTEWVDVPGTPPLVDRFEGD